MRKTLYLKFCLAYLIFGFFGFFVVATFVSNMTLEHLQREKSEALYKEAQEEIGINLDEYNFIYLDKVKVYSPTNCCFSHHYYIDAEISLDEFVIQKEELSEVLYMDYEKLKNLAKNNDSSIVFQWKEPYINIFNKLDELFSK